MSIWCDMLLDFVIRRENWFDFNMKDAK